MKRVLQFGVAALALTQITGQAAVGSMIVQNNNGGTIIPIFDVDGTTKLGGANYSIGVYVVNPDGSVISQVGGFVSPGATNFRFSGGTQDVGIAGGTVQLSVHAWDTRTGATHATAVNKAASPVFTSPVLGGDADNDPSTPAGVPLSMALNFKSFSLVNTSNIPEPSTMALAALGLGGLIFISRRK